jgi:hypothetical protein
MATSTRTRSTRQTARGGYGDAGALFVITNTITLTGALATNEVHEACRVPAGFTPLRTLMVVSDMDTNGAPTLVLSLGDAASNGRLISGSIIGQTGGVQAQAPTYTPARYAVATNIILTATTAAATGVSGTVTVYLEGFVS